MADMSTSTPAMVTIPAADVALCVRAVSWRLAENYDVGATIRPWIADVIGTLVAAETDGADAQIAADDAHGIVLNRSLYLWGDHSGADDGARAIELAKALHDARLVVLRPAD